jgi:hypothetical protein
LKFHRARHDRYLARPVDLAYALQAVSNNAHLSLKLAGINYLLEIAAAAGSEIRARRRNALGRGLYNAHNFGKCDLLFLTRDIYIDDIARGRQRSKNG